MLPLLLGVPAIRVAVPGQLPPSQDIAPPVITDIVPADGSFVPTAMPAMSARYHDRISGVNAASVPSGVTRRFSGTGTPCKGDTLL